jgi:hypothetical protein
VHRRTVRQAVGNAVPPPRKEYAPRSRPAIDPFVELIDGWLLGDRQVPRKQRHTARRVWQRLVAEQHASLAEVTVSRYVARRRVELGLDRVRVAVPLTHPPGAEAEVDFGEFYARIAGSLIKVWMFVIQVARRLHAVWKLANEPLDEGPAPHVTVTNKSNQPVTVVVNGEAWVKNPYPYEEGPSGAIWDEEDGTFEFPAGKTRTQDLGLLGNTLFVADGGRITKITMTADLQVSDEDDSLDPVSCPLKLTKSG